MDMISKGILWTCLIILLLSSLTCTLGDDTHTGDNIESLSSNDEILQNIEVSITTSSTVKSPTTSSNMEQNQQIEDGKENNEQRVDETKTSPPDVDAPISTSTPASVDTSTAKINENDKEYLMSGWNPGTFKRMLYVLVGISTVVILYFVVKAVRLRSRTTRVREYGMLSRSSNRRDVEMSPLDSGDDDDDGEDEDTTLFDKAASTAR